MTESEVLELWKNVVGDPAPEPWGEDNVFGYFQRFRPDGEGLSAAIGPLPEGNEIHARLIEVYSCAKHGWRTGDGEDMYFVVRRAPSLSNSELKVLAYRQLDAWSAIAQDFGDSSVSGWLTPRPKVEIERSNPPMDVDYDAPDVAIYDIESDWFGGLESVVPSPYAVMEAFYSIACDYSLARYLTWPWYRASCSLDDPFRPYFDIWRQGATLSYPEPGRAVMHCPLL